MLKRIQNLPKSRRKVILWMAMVIICAGLLFLFVKNIQNRFGNFSAEQLKQEINLPNLGEALNKLPQIATSTE